MCTNVLHIAHCGCQHCIVPGTVFCISHIVAASTALYQAMWHSIAQLRCRHKAIHEEMDNWTLCRSSVRVAPLMSMCPKFSSQRYGKRLFPSCRLSTESLLTTVCHCAPLLAHAPCLATFQTVQLSVSCACTLFLVIPSAAAMCM